MAGDDEEEKSCKGTPQNDKINLTILIFLYILQGIPLGLNDSTKLLLQNKNVTYKEQALFSLADWPFSIKLLWAPIVDSLYWKPFGRRKSWLIPVQSFLGIFMLILSSSISSLLGDAGSSPDVSTLTMAFLCMDFLAATQDIAVDGWALTMLSRQNVGYASVCSSAGQRIGYFLGNVVFLLLESPEFCNQYLRSVPQPEGLVTLCGFLKISGITFIIATLLILIFKSEQEEECLKIHTIKDTYTQLYHVVCLKNVLLLIVFLMTFQIALSATDAVTKLKFIEVGVRKENMALLETPKYFVEILFPFYISSYIAGVKPLNMFLKAFPYKLMFGFLFSILICWTHYIKLEFNIFPTHYYVIIVLSFMLHEAISICIHLPLSSFFNKVSDPAIGGTYMTLLATFCNLGYSWTSTLALWWVDVLTQKKCDGSIYNCDTTESALTCTNAGYSCLTVVDGYYIESVSCIIFGFLWLKWGRSVIQKLQMASLSEWRTPQCWQRNLYKA